VPPGDPDLPPGARHAVRTCLRVASRERVVLVTDQATREIAASLAAEVGAVAAPQETYVLEDSGRDP
jgi:hypothetical protein